MHYSSVLAFMATAFVASRPVNVGWNLLDASRHDLGNHDGTNVARSVITEERETHTVSFALANHVDGVKDRPVLSVLYVAHGEEGEETWQGGTSPYRLVRRQEDIDDSSIGFHNYAVEREEYVDIGDQYGAAQAGTETAKNKRFDDREENFDTGGPDDSIEATARRGEVVDISDINTTGQVATMEDDSKSLTLKNDFKQVIIGNVRRETDWEITNPGAGDADARRQDRSGSIYSVFVTPFESGESSAGQNGSSAKGEEDVIPTPIVDGQIESYDKRTPQLSKDIGFNAGGDGLRTKRAGNVDYEDNVAISQFHDDLLATTGSTSSKRDIGGALGWTAIQVNRQDRTSEVAESQIHDNLTQRVDSGSADF